MIDDRDRTMELIEQMESMLPIPVNASNALIRFLRQQGTRIRAKQRLQIEKVFYAGDEGGIMCALTGVQSREAAYVCSLTHLRISHKHPLAKAIRTYQRERSQTLVQQQPFGTRH